MIFLTVGSQLPFDRLVRAVDEWAATRGKEVVGQVGASKLNPRRIAAVPNLDSQEFAKKMQEATAIVSHAGMGTILSALALRKPILIMPRMAQFKEHRNDHQIATVKQLHGRSGVLVAMRENEVSEQLDALENLAIADSPPNLALDQLISGIRSFIGTDAIR